MVLDTESDTVHIYRQMVVRPSAALQQAQPPSAGQAAFSFTCLGGLPHCQQRCLPLLFLRRSVTKELAPEWSGVVETCCGRLSCWQWGRPPLVHSWGWGAAQARCKGSVFFKRKFSFTCLGGLPHCQQLSLPQHVGPRAKGLWKCLASPSHQRPRAASQDIRPKQAAGAKD